MPKHSPLEDSPWQEEDSYYDRLREASKDPETFEKFVEDTMSSREDGGEKKSDDISSSEAIKFARGDDEGNSKKPKQYVPIEEWDKNNGDNMTKEERLQWECQRNGDQFRQNEILTQNLKRF
ncbi:hypothetical protein ACHAW5_000154 [Stephanodiscus triporus]|uniref:Uncharacterized protein n=1 Tax=Stephanodiscus triporus TaxID=2934178 RepID=A0ABD3PDL7_9STRA